jgi:hypothetical protein
LSDLQATIVREFEAAALRAERLEATLESLSSRPDRSPRRAESRPPAESSGDNWHGVIFGETLAGQDELREEREAVIDALHDRDPAACSLAGQLLVFHAATGAQKPQLLKDLGEAFYRWQPNSSQRRNLLERALVAWLESECEQAGIRRKIQIVDPGSRFNATYHRAGERGVEIVQVLGWVILREDGTVYQKALVEVR